MKHKNKIIIVISVVFVVAIIAVGLFIYNKNKQENNKTEDIVVLKENVIVITDGTDDNLQPYKIDENNLNDNGSMMLGYLWDINFDETTYRDDWKDIYKMPIVKEKLGKYLSESYQVLDAKDILW